MTLTRRFWPTKPSESGCFLIISPETKFILKEVLRYFVEILLNKIEKNFLHNFFKPNFYPKIFKSKWFLPLVIIFPHQQIFLSSIWKNSILHALILLTYYAFYDFIFKLKRLQLRTGTIFHRHYHCTSLITFSQWQLKTKCQLTFSNEMWCH